MLKVMSRAPRSAPQQPDAASVSAYRPLLLHAADSNHLLNFFQLQSSAKTFFLRQ